MGDLMRMSERLRWLGPLRYTVAGALVMLLGRTYAADLKYLLAEPNGYSTLFPF